MSLRELNEQLKTAIFLFQDATEKDNAKEYEEALSLYAKALEYFDHVRKYETIKERRVPIEKKMNEIVGRAEDIKTYLEGKKKKKKKKKKTRTEKCSASESEDLDEQEGSDGEEGRVASGRKKKELKKFSHELESTIVDMSNDENKHFRVRWEEIAGLEYAKDALREAIVLPVELPSLFTGARKPWKSILMHGPPGTGKSELARAAATELNATFMNVSSTDLVSKWQGESEKYVRAMFKLARERQPTIIFIDEIDSMCGARGEGDNEASRRIKDQFLVQMNDLDGGKVLVMAATNMPWALDAGMIRRFNKRIFVSLPSKQARMRIFQIRMHGIEHNLSHQDFSQLAESTDGYSGSDIALCTREAMMRPVRKVQNATHYLPVEGGQRFMPCSPGLQGAVEMTYIEVGDKRLVPPIVTMRDMLSAVQSTRPSVNPDTLPKYVEWNERFAA